MSTATSQILMWRWRIGLPTPWPLTEGTVRTGIPGRNIWLGRQECPPAKRVSLPLGQTSSSQGIGDVSGGGPRRSDGNVVDPCDSAASDRTLYPAAEGNVSPQASPGSRNDIGRRARCPSDDCDGYWPSGRGTQDDGNDVGSANAPTGTNGSAGENAPSAQTRRPASRPDRAPRRG